MLIFTTIMLALWLAGVVHSQDPAVEPHSQHALPPAPPEMAADPKKAAMLAF
jgi:hypothetical protein